MSGALPGGGGEAAAWPYRLGCPVWSERRWVGEFYRSDARVEDFLAQYASVFGCVEGNSTFYGLPTAATVERWTHEAPATLRFCFKVPRTLTHERALQGGEAELAEFLDRLAPLAQAGRLGPLLLQLPASFGPPALADLFAFLDRHLAGRAVVVEVRHAEFFAKGAAERALNRGLHARGVDRVMMDTRALFSTPPPDAAAAEAQRKKPRLPVHAVALGPRPCVRFVGHPQLERNRGYLAPWVDKLAQWVDEGREPWFFAHMADNREAPALARLFHLLLRERLPQLPALAPWPAQREPQQAGLF